MWTIPEAGSVVYSWTPYKKNMKLFSERIKEARAKLGLSQSDFARKWRFPKQTINAWEHGLRIPHGLYRQKIERILKRTETTQ